MNGTIHSLPAAPPPELHDRRNTDQAGEIPVVNDQSNPRGSGDRRVTGFTGGGAEITARVLLLKSIAKTFVVQSKTFKALEPIDLEVTQGECVSLIGPSGCGKSTLFNIIAGLETADEGGQVFVDGHAVSGSRREIGVVFQEDSTFPWRTVLENVALPLELAGMREAERVETAQRFIDMVGLRGFERHYPSELSGGMRQRTAIARTLAFKPHILLLDEPFAALDEQTRLLLGDKLQAICTELHQTTLLITHSISEAVLLSDRVLVMSFRPGRIKRVVKIELPRRRVSSMLSSEVFGRYVGEIWEELRVEALKGAQAAEAT